MNKRTVLIILFLLIIGALSVYFILIAQPKKETDMPMSKASAQAVSVLKLQSESIANTQSLPGRISAFRQSQVRPQVNGIIVKRLFEEGTLVANGQQLYQVDDARFKAALASAEADLKSAGSNIASVKAKAGRYKELVKINAVSRQEYDDLQTELDQARASNAVAQAAVDLAKVNLDYTKVYAPIEGRIGRSLVTEGALVTANQSQPMAVITQMEPVYVDLQQASIESKVLQQASLSGESEVAVSIMLGNQNQVEYPQQGSLKFSEVTINESTGSIALRATMPNPNGVLLPGLFVRAVLDFGDKQVLLVPQRSTIRQPDGSLTVWVVDANNKASPRSIKAQSAYQSSWIVSDGLKAGETIIIEGYQKIAPNADVITSPWKQQAQASSSTQEQG